MQLDSYIGVSRVSRVSRVGGREGDSYTTVEDQRQIIATLAKRNGITLGIEVVEEDVSGRERPRIALSSFPCAVARRGRATASSWPTRIASAVDRSRSRQRSGNGSELVIHDS